MSLPDPFEAGPFNSEQEFEELNTAEENEARRHGYRVTVKRIDRDGQIFASVTYAEGTAAAAAGAVAGAAAGGAAGAAVAGPIGAAAGAAIGAVVGNAMAGGSGGGTQPATPAAAEDPPWLSIAHTQIGEIEVPGSGSNPRIEEYFSWTSLGEQPDEVPWCGAFVSFCLGKAGMLKKRKGSARAADWLNLADPTEPKTGCIVVVKPPPGSARSGHVAFLERMEGDRVFLLGGNQSDKVMVSPYRMDQVAGFRWPRNLA